MIIKNSDEDGYLEIYEECGNIFAKVNDRGDDLYLREYGDNWELMGLVCRTKGIWKYKLIGKLNISKEKSMYLIRKKNNFTGYDEYVCNTDPTITLPINNANWDKFEKFSTYNDAHRKWTDLKYDKPEVWDKSSGNPIDIVKVNIDLKVTEIETFRVSSPGTPSNRVLLSQVY